MRCVEATSADQIIAPGPPPVRMRLTVLCELQHGHDGPHQSTMPAGNVYQWPNNEPREEIER